MTSVSHEVVHAFDRSPPLGGRAVDVATIYDVARAVGKSTKTVSRVLNDESPVSPATRDAVHRAMDELGYVPSSAARGLRSHRSGLVGLITGAISDSHADQPTGLPEILVVRGIQSVMRARGKTLLITDTGGDAHGPARLARTLSEHRVEGLIHVGSHHAEVSLPALADVPEVVLANCYDAVGTPAVVPDDRTAQRALVERLIGAGHRRIGFITLPDGLVATKLRLAGYRDALETAGIGVDPALVASTSQEALYRVRGHLGERVGRLLALDDPPSVICCGQDRMALNLYGILRSRGLSIPDDISVAGHDDHRVIAETLYPPLTTVQLPYVDIGERAARSLLARLDGEAPDGDVPVRLHGPVVWRGSVADVRGDAPSITTPSHTQ